jgi:hypothetical protein
MVITALDQQPVRHGFQFERLVGAKMGGDEVGLSIAGVEGGRAPSTVTVRLAAVPAAQEEPDKEDKSDKDAGS